MMNVREVAEYLNLKERKIYDLVRTGSIPCSRVTGKWLFPLHLIDEWVAGGIGEGDGPPQSRRRPPPPVVAGSHDPLLEWALRDSDCGLALMPGGSLAGLERLREGKAQVCGLHIFQPESGEYNLQAIRQSFASAPMVLIEWAWREQGLAVAPGNPLGITGLGGLGGLNSVGARVVLREPEAGTRLLFDYLLGQAGEKPEDIGILPRVARTQMEVALAVLEGQADAGLCVEAAARQLRLDFLPLHRGRYDLALHRRDFFEPPFQRLLRFAQGPEFQARASTLGGYDISGLGTVHFNGP